MSALTAEQITTLFIRYIEKDEKLINTLNAFDPNYLQANEWQFKLPSLFLFVQHYYPQTHCEYKNFRKLLFNSPINHQLGAYNAQVTIHTQQNHVDNTLYSVATRPS